MATDYGSFSWPGSVSSNPSVGTNGSTAPVQSTQVGGVGADGNLHPLSTTNTGVLNVNVSSTTTTPLPVTDAAAEASLASIDTKSTSIVTNTGNTATSTASIDTKTPALGQALMAASVPVAIASDQSAVPISASALPLPTGAATEATLAKIPLAQASTTSGQSGALIQGAVTTAAPTYTTGQTNPLSLTTAGALRVDSSGSTQPVSGTVTVVQPTGTNLHAVIDSGTVAATQSGTWNINNISGTVSLPTGAATSALQTQISGQLPSTLGQKASAASLAVVLASDQSSVGILPAGYSKANAPTYNVYSSTPVTTSAYVQLVASTTSATKQLQIFDSSGQAMIIATGAAASEVDQIYVPPGGGIFNLAIAASTRVSIKALTATASSGYLLVDYLG